MQVDEIRALQKKSPFQPYTLHLANGIKVPVPHPEFIWIPPGRTLFITDKEGKRTIVDATLVTNIDLL